MELSVSSRCYMDCRDKLETHRVIAGKITKYAGLFAFFCCLMFFGNSRATTDHVKPNEPGKTPIVEHHKKPNELGKVPILEYHLIQSEKSVWARTADAFRQDLELLYDSGYRSVSLNDFIQGKINLPAGMHPVIFTFDDSSPGQFRYLVRNGIKIIDPDCAVGIFLDFNKRHPDFGMHATFFVLPGANEPHKLFGQPEYEFDKLKKLVSLGFEIGNHTLWHANLSKYSGDVVRKQLATAVQAIQAATPGCKVNTLALPFGAYPKNITWAVNGTYRDIIYHNEAILRVSGGPSASPFTSSWDPLRLPRTQAAGNDVKRMVDYFKKHPDEVFVSDGNSDTVTYPADRKTELDSSRFKDLQYLAY
jgi:hypothetical protein